MILSGNSDFTRELLKVLGLEGQKVFGLHLSIKANEAISVTIEKHLIDREAGEIPTLVKKYNLALVEPEDGKVSYERSRD